MNNSTDQKDKADCYSAGERRAMLWTQDLRGYWLRPLLVALTARGIGPDQITFVSLLAGLAFCPLFFYRPPLALLMLLLHVLLDGLDGPLARHSGVASRRGSFTDSMVDQTVVVASTICLMAGPQHPLNVIAGGVYIFVYTMTVVFAMVRNALEIPYSWLVRPRFVVYGWIAVDLYLLPGTLTAVVWICNALLAWKMLTGFWKIRYRIPDVTDQ